MPVPLADDTKIQPALFQHDTEFTACPLHNVDVCPRINPSIISDDFTKPPIIDAVGSSYRNVPCFQTANLHRCLPERLSSVDKLPNAPKHAFTFRRGLPPLRPRFNRGNPFSASSAETILLTPDGVYPNRSAAAVRLPVSILVSSVSGKKKL